MLDSSVSDTPVKKPANSTVASNQFHRPLHLYRALAITLIVAAHSWSLPIFFYSPDFSLDPQLKLLSAFTETLFHDGTIIFALISGLLFSLVLEQKGWQRFFINKMKYVLSPYIVISFVYGLIQWKLMFVGFYDITPNNFAGYLSATLNNIPQGLAGFHLWYIPVLLIIFIATPLLSLLISRRSILIALILLAPLVCSRVWPMFSWSTVVYFLGPYTLGMLIGGNLHQSLAHIRRYRSLLFVIFIITSAFLIFLYQIEIKVLGEVSLLESGFYLQKLALALLLLDGVYLLEHKIPQWVDSIGNYSFAIYFIHPALLLYLVGILKEQQLLTNNPWLVIILGTLFLGCGLFGTLVISKLIKKLCGKYTRYLIGA
ncbi:acyltransferase family protein [Colwellia sp. MEBiC06753]